MPPPWHPEHFLNGLLGAAGRGMILSASRRTDLPALYASWFERRLREGFCTVPNPFNPTQVRRISLRPEDVDAIVFWTRHARPLLDTLPLLDRLGVRYYFHYTMTGYGPPAEPRVPPLAVALRTFRELAGRLPPGAVVWRYDPIPVGEAFPLAGHLERFARIAGGLEGRAERVVISLLDAYRKTERRMARHFEWGTELVRDPASWLELPALLEGLVRIAREHGLAVEACAPAQDWTALGIGPTRCIDDRLLGRLFGGTWPAEKDPGQRPHCRCVPSRDIGIPDTCTLGCLYCYTTRSDELARRRRSESDPDSPSLWGRYDAATPSHA